MQHNVAQYGASRRILVVALEKEDVRCPRCFLLPEKARVLDLDQRVIVGNREVKQCFMLSLYSFVLVYFSFFWPFTNAFNSHTGPPDSILLALNVAPRLLYVNQQALYVSQQFSG